MRKLSEVVDGRDNNLDLIRLVAAFAVLVSHAWPITGGPGTVEPLQNLTGATLGTFAVMVFFGISGFLITASYQRDPDPWRFCSRRARRLWPGLAACLCFTVVCLGGMFGALSFAEFLSDQRVWTFLISNASMLDFQGDLPGLFSENPYPTAAGSIWTLQYEVACYGAVLLAGTLGLLTNRRLASMTLICGILVSVGICLAHPEEFPTRVIRLAEFAIPFAFGGLAWIFRDQISMSPVVCLCLVGASALGHGTVIQSLLTPLAITYLTLFLGYNWSSIFRLPGDYSYGVYIYAFPLQGLVLHLYGPMTPWTNVLLAVPFTFMFAALSWHFIEKPCLMRSKQQSPVVRLKLSLK